MGATAASGHEWITFIGKDETDLDRALREHETVADIAREWGIDPADVLSLIGRHGLGHRVAPTHHDREVTA